MHYGYNDTFKINSNIKLTQTQNFISNLGFAL
mgnify:CR=1 FL=1